MRRWVTVGLVAAGIWSLFGPCRSNAQDSNDVRGEYSLEVEGGHADDALRLIVRRNSVVIARIDPNLGGAVNPMSFRARFVAGSNILASWGCGTYCKTTVLFSPTGRLLASFGIHRVSPTGTFAIAYPAFDAPGFGDLVDVIDLRTGATVHSEHAPDAWNTCRVHWRSEGALLEPCSPKTQQVEIHWTAVHQR